VFSHGQVIVRCHVVRHNFVLVSMKREMFSNSEEEIAIITIDVSSF
jgi:hypothetical protein